MATLLNETHRPNGSNQVLQLDRKMSRVSSLICQFIDNICSVCNPPPPQPFFFQANCVGPCLSGAPTKLFKTVRAAEKRVWSHAICISTRTHRKYLPCLIQHSRRHTAAYEIAVYLFFFSLSDTLRVNESERQTCYRMYKAAQHKTKLIFPPQVCLYLLRALSAHLCRLFNSSYASQQD